jgi:hypothetical protein
MPEHEDKLAIVHEHLDTAYVNLAALVRYLEGREFTGLVHVELDEYDGDIFLHAGRETRARERNHATGATAEGAAAWQRLCVRAGEPGGLVSVYEGDPDELEKREPAGEAAYEADTTPGAVAEESERRELLRLSGELVAAVERAVLVAGGDFEAALHAARVGLTEDFPFLDPLARRFEYDDDGTVRMHGAWPTTGLYVSGINEALRRVVERVATVEQKIGVRKDAVRELSTLLRRRQTALARCKFTRQQFERIAGMKLM